MTIDMWAGLWKIVLITCVALFALMWLIVSIGGIKDAAALYRDLRSNDPSPGSNEDDRGT